MTNAEAFHYLFNGGNISLPYLIEIKNKTKAIRLVNNNNPISYGGKTYAISTFDYTPPENDGTGGALSLTSIDNEVYELLESTEVDDKNYSLNIIGLLIKVNEVQKIKTYNHFQGSISMSENMIIDFQLQGDDKLDLQFPPYICDTDTNRANA